MTTIDQKLTAIYAVLNADTTLRDANHLNGTGKIFKFATRPTGYSGEALTMNLFPTGISGEQSFADEDLLRLVLYMPNAVDMTPIMNRTGSIENRIAILLDEKEAVSGSKFYRTRRDIPGRLLPVDPQAPEEHAWVFQYFLRSK